MKRVMALLLTLALALGACACGGPGGGQSSAGEEASGSEASPAVSSGASSGASSGPEAQTEEPDAEDGNPIDALYEPYWQDAQSTLARNTVSAAWRDAWRAELTAFVRDMESESADRQDLADLEGYLKNADGQAEALRQMTDRVGAGADVPREERSDLAGTAAPASAAISAKETYRSAFYRMYAVRYPGEADWKWTFASDAEKGILEAALYGG